MEKTPPAIKLYKGVSIYRVANSPNWYVRVWDRTNKKYIVKSTGFDSVIKARDAAQEFALSWLKVQIPVDSQYQFRTFALKLLNQNRLLVKTGEKSDGYAKSIQWAIQNRDWGLLDWFGEKDVRKIKTHSYRQYLAFLYEKRPDLSRSTLNTLMVALRSVLKVALEAGVIDAVPSTPRPKGKDNPRPFFRFPPMAPERDYPYLKLRRVAKQMAENGVVVRGIPVTAELHDLIVFVVQTFVRPITTELYALRHSDIVKPKDREGLLVTVRNGKTGTRVANTMPNAPDVYDRICKRYPDHTPDDYLFLPQYSNRETAARIIQRQFHQLLKTADLEVDEVTGKRHALYSLRHTAICLRIIKSEGKVNIYNLAKNAGTSVDQIERFYAKYLPLTAEMARNLQSFGE